MKCPECLERIHDHAEECPHCGTTLQKLRTGYDNIDSKVNDGVHDVAGVLNIDSRKQMRAAVKLCEKQFTGVNVGVSFVALKDDHTLENYGFWLMNYGIFHRDNVHQSELEDGRGRVIIVVDVEGKRVGLSYGYYFDGCISEKENFDVISTGHANLLEGELVLGCEQILIALKGLLKKAVIRSRKRVKK